MQNRLIYNKKLGDITSDVVWRFYVYEKYGKDHAKALKALAKRAPGHSDKFYKDIFELYLALLVATIDAVESAPISTKQGQIYSDYSDIDMDHVMDQLRARFSGQSDNFLNSFTGMTIYYYYLR